MKISIGILTGGKSKRMGANKAFLKYNEEKNFLEHALDEALAVSDDVILSVDEEGKYINFLKGREKAGLKLVEDERKNYGPLEGLYRILKAAKEDYCFIFAVDMPYVEKAFVDAFVSYIEDAGSFKDIFVVKKGDRSEPLCAIYSKKLIPYIEEMFEKEEHRLKMLLDTEGLSVESIDINKLGACENIAENINTPSDYKELFLK
ncbi:MAG: molybdenum cofactor guanylyltransferase [Lachnospiraceae bacterium]|nr:molybdenum cofactor guanylyltransferase [Lachnospiraceae bacterium]